MKIHYFQHVAFEDPAFIIDWVKENKYKLTSTLFFENNYQLPTLEDFDILIVMGGPMNIYEYDAYPYLKVEKEFIKKAIENDKKIIGICLGAQLIADALGAKIYSNKTKEIGWIPITTFNNSFLPKEITPLHWHGDTFELPENAKLIASSVDCKNQAFIYNEKIIGFQFHLEANEKSLNAIIKNCGHELIDKGNIMNEYEMKKLSSKYFKKNQNIMKNVLEYLSKIN